MIRREDIAKLVEKFLDGRTTIAEERALYEWFRCNDVDEGWQPLKEMFAWYEGGMSESLGDELKVDITTAATPLSRSIRLRRWATGISAAAAVVVAVLAAIYGRSEPINIYEGSFVICNGQFCDDIETISSDIEALLDYAEEMQQRADSVLALVDNI